VRICPAPSGHRTSGVTRQGTASAEERAGLYRCAYFIKEAYVIVAFLDTTEITQIALTLTACLPLLWRSAVHWQVEIATPFHVSCSFQGHASQTIVLAMHLCTLHHKGSELLCRCKVESCRCKVESCEQDMKQAPVVYVSNLDYHATSDLVLAAFEAADVPAVGGTLRPVVVHATVQLPIPRTISPSSIVPVPHALCASNSTL